MRDSVEMLYNGLSTKADLMHTFTHAYHTVTDISILYVQTSRYRYGPLESYAKPRIMIAAC